MVGVIMGGPIRVVRYAEKGSDNNKWVEHIGNGTTFIYIICCCLFKVSLTPPIFCDINKLSLLS